MKKPGFRSSRIISNILYTASAAALVYRLLWAKDGLPVTVSLIAFGVTLIAGTAFYSLGCTCPKCGRIQPRGNRYECAQCGARLQERPARKGR